MKNLICRAVHKKSISTDCTSKPARAALNALSAVLFVLLLSSSLLFHSIAQAIDAPTDPRGTVVRSDEIKWEWNLVSDAARYDVHVNGAYVGTTVDTHFYSRDLAAGTYAFTVQARHNDGSYSQRSNLSDARTIGAGQSSNNSTSNTSNSNTTTSNTQSSGGNAGSSDLPAPRDTRGTLVRPAEIKWEWGHVSGAERYEVFVDNASVGITVDSFVYTKNLGSGEHSMFVRSIDSNGNQSVNSAVATRSVGNTGVAQSAASSNDTTNNTPAARTSQSSLSAPRDPRGTRVRPSEIKWEWSDVSGANEYEVTVDGTAQRTAVNFLYTKDLFVGEHTMTVRAIDGSGQLSTSSAQARASTWEAPQGGSTQSNNTSTQASNQSSSGVFGAPQNVRGTQINSNEIRWEWNSVISANKYVVYLNGNRAGDTSDDFLVTGGLQPGIHAVSIQAINNDGRWSAPSDRAAVTISSNGSFDDNNTVAPPPAQNDNGLIDPQSYNYNEVSQKSGYQLVFSDEFNGNSLNRARWNTQLRWDGSFNGDRYEYRIINGEAQFYVNIFSADQEHLNRVASVYNPFQFNGNRLAIRSTRNPLRQNNSTKSYGPLDMIATQQPFLSGAISTYDKFQQKYGYFEARMKIPAHMGTFPAFWLHHHLREWEGTQKTEIDIMENLGHAPQYVYNSFHYFTGVSEGVSGTAHFVKPQPEGQISHIPNYTTDYHVYAAEWKPGHIRFLIDGQQVSEIRNGNSDYEELYLIINLAVGGIWTNLPTNAGGSGRRPDERFPTDNDINTWGDPALEIDYVRVYKAQ